MPKVIDTARITTRAAAVWQVCIGCGRTFANTTANDRCGACTSRNGRRRTVHLLTRPGITAAREVYTRASTDALRIAALVDIAGSAAALARTAMKYRRLDPVALIGLVADPVDLYAVLGKGRWLPTMTRHVPEPPSGPMPAGLLLPPAVVRPAHRATRSRPAGTVDLTALAQFRW